MSLVQGQDQKDKSITRTADAVQNQKTGGTAIMVDTDMIKTTFTAEYTADQTAQAIITPTSGYKLCIRSVEITTDAVTGVVELDFATSTKKVSRLYAAAQNRSTSNTAHLLGATNEPLTITTTTGAGKKVFLVITYVEHM